MDWFWNEKWIVWLSKLITFNFSELQHKHDKHSKIYNKNIRSKLGRKIQNKFSCLLSYIGKFSIEVFSTKCLKRKHCWF